MLDHLLELNENIRMFRGMIDWFGFPTAVIPFSAPERFHGKANYSYSKLFQLALTSITSFSLWPLRLTGYAGVLIATLSLLDPCYFFDAESHTRRMVHHAVGLSYFV